MKTFTTQQVNNAIQLLDKFILENIKEFNKLENSEVEYINEDEFDVDVIDYLKLNNRYNKDGIAIYIEGCDVCIENMNA